MAWRISSVVGAGVASTSATALTIWPGVQKPHCSASARTNESTIGWSRSPSIVVTSRAVDRWTSVMHESVGTPSTSTVHAPQWPSPQAIFVPVSAELVAQRLGERRADRQRRRRSVLR